MALTTEQREFWREIGFDGLPADPTEQQRNFYVASIRQAFTLEGIDPPSDADILAEGAPALTS